MLASLVLINGRIYTQQPGQPYVTAIAIVDDKILAVGPDDEMRALLRPGGKLINLEGRFVTPGLVDAHVHFRSLALEMQRLDLTNTRSLDDVLSCVSQAASTGGSEEWLLGRGWNQADWASKVFPQASDLDLVVPNRPVMLRHKSGHAAWVNRRALVLSGIDHHTPDPPGGHIQRDPDGSPTGILFEEAIKLVSNHVPKPNLLELADAMVRAQERCLRAGLTGIHDFDGRSCFQALQLLHQADSLKLRVVKNIPLTRLEHALGLGLRTGFGDNWLRIGGVKMFADGALGSKTAAMIAPYEGEPENRGLVVSDKEVLFANANIASANGISVSIHAIGDRANHDVLDVFEALRKEENARLESELFMSNPLRIAHAQQKKPTPPLRHRIEHAQLLHPEDIGRFAQLGIIASMQPIHATADMEMADRYWGQRARYGYAWRTLLESGATLVFGSDSPVDPVEPLTGIYAAVSRRRSDGTPGEDGWYPEQRLTIAQALSAYTLGPAIASAQEQLLGSISPGKLADLTIFDRDIFAVSADEILELKVDGTMVNGQMMYGDL